MTRRRTARRRDPAAAGTGRAGLGSDPPRVEPEVVAILVGAVALWIGFRIATGIRLEDALITARYAENLAAGRGYVFNPGERVLGTTSPLHTLILALLALPFGGAHLDGIAVGVGIASAAAAVFLLHRALRIAGIGRVPAAVAAALFAAQADTLWATTGGLETPLVLCFMTMGLEAVLASRWIRAGVAAGLLVLTRVDGLVWAGLLVIPVASALRGRAWKPLLAGLLVVAPWTLFAWIDFGSPVPHSIVAKRAISAGPGLVSYPQWLFDSLGLHFTKYGTPVPFGVWIALVAIGAVVILADRARRRLWPIVVFPPVFAAAMAALQAPWFEWYLIPVTWCGIVLAVLGGEAVIRAFANQAAARASSAKVAHGTAAALMAVVVGGVAVQDARAFEEQRAVQENEDKTRRVIGEWLRANTPANAVVAMEAIGYQGTYARRRVVDLAGIVTPEVVRIRRHSRTNAETFERILERFRPDAVVLRTLEVERGLAIHGGPLFETPEQKARFLARYRAAATFVAPHIELWGPFAAVTIYRRVR